MAKTLSIDIDTFDRLSDPDQVLAMIKAFGICRLAFCDGCKCGRFSLRYIDVEFYCGKGGSARGVHVSSRSLDYAKEGKGLLRPIAREVQRQLEADDRGPAPITID